MRIMLATAVAIAPLMAASGAMAEVVISTARTTPITTANATGSGPDSIRLASGGSITVNSGVGVTVNSSHDFTLEAGGGISLDNAPPGATGVLIEGGNTANVSINGTISLPDDILAGADTDTDNDGDIDGPFAHGSDRYGVRLTGAAPLTGDITVGSAGQVVVDGDNSYGISLEAPLAGGFDMLGTVQATGADSYGVRVTGDVSGDLRTAGKITARGPGSTALAVEGDVGGAMVIHSDISASGYRYTARPADRPAGFVDTAQNDEGTLFLDELEAEDLLQGGPAVSIRGNVAGGVVLDRGPAYGGIGIEGDDDGDGVKNGDEDDDGDGTPNRSDTDRDGDGLADTGETTATVNVYGSAPAVEIGSATRSITLGPVGAGDSAYGFINRGNVTAEGVYDGVAANGVVVGGNAGQTVDVAGGVRNDGTIAALAYDADATAVRFGDGANVPGFVNTNAVTAGSNSDQATTTTAVRIDAGATVDSLVNSGIILASTAGGTADTFAIRDLGGTLTSITNNRSIQAAVNANADNDPVTGVATAIDVSANTTGVTLVQSGVAATPTAANPDTDGDGVPDDNEPAIYGAVNLGSGGDTVDIRNGLVVGDIAFGAGADRLAITGGAVVRGALSDSDGALDIDVTDGTLEGRHATALNLGSLNVGADGDLIVTVDPANGAAGTFNVSGTATLADGAGLGVRFNSLLAAPGRFTLIDANTLNYGAIDVSSIAENSPFLYVVETGADVAAGQVFAEVRRRTAEEADLIAAEAQMFDAFYGALGGGGADALRTAFLSQTGRDGFLNLYEQLLPEHSGGPLLSLASGVDAVTRALTGRNASAAPGETSAWVQEINFYADKDKTDTYGFRSEGFGVAGGVERGSDLGAVGLSLAFTSSDLEDPEAEAEEVLSASLLELGLYWRAQGQFWTTWARAAAGYASLTSERRFVGEGLNLSNESDWNGFTLAAAGGLSYERAFGRFTIRPEAYAEFFSLREDGHLEEGGGDGFDLEIDDRDGHLFSATAAINLGMKMGQNDWLRPEVRVGWRQNISVDPGETIARFRSGGGDFTLSPDTIEGGGPILGFRLNVGNELGMLSVSADAEMIDDYVRYMLFLRASFRF
ncbi:autotransporter outer membrane beta-barrel domain-containing protein [uncultured Brevundimonas sp.]|uniref:autotransporter outer membrane beta-barrel domain-containing protein n=1 Tax=uncultured Brevundimonas sp. TaxID=213418 RepID=UPI002611A950|nr:autotransporter outer membrane beta-barrel domain-containing protein [uncultured Brevundimonas sp.]